MRHHAPCGVGASSISSVPPEQNRWFPFPPGFAIDIDIHANAGACASSRAVKSGIAQMINAHEIIIHTTAFITPGTQVRFPLDTVDGEKIYQTGTVESCAMVSVRVHRTIISFGFPLTPEHFVICWGVAVGDEGPTGPMPSRAAALETTNDDGAIRCKTRDRIARQCDRLSQAVRGGSSAREIREIVDQIVVMTSQMPPD